MLICCQVAGEGGWFGKKLRDGTWNGVAWRYVVRWKVKLIGLLIR